MDQSIQFENAILQYHTSGKGPQPLLIFHGFGQGKGVFQKLSSNLSENYTLYIFDLFFHGNSEWNYGERPLEKSFWKNLVASFLNKHRIERFSMLGYSMGGKFALACLEAFPEKIEHIFLLAPDGIRISPWYKLATHPIVVRKLFKSLILNPNRFKIITSFASKLGLIDRGIVRFAESQMDTEEKRKQVYYSWVVFRHLTFDVANLASLINSNTIQLTLVVGKYDRIITAKNMEGFLKKVKKYNFEILETGHTGLLSKLESLG